MIAQAFKYITLERERQADLYDSQHSLVYNTSSRLAKTIIKKNTVLLKIHFLPVKAETRRGNKTSICEKLLE